MLHSTQEFVPRAQIQHRDTPLRKLLMDVTARKDSEYIIVAVRPDGIELFAALRDQIENRGIQIGYEPIDSEWKVKARL
jgi:hypothetical protein